MRPWFGSDNVRPLWLEVGKVLASVFGDVSKLLFLPLLVCICRGMILKVVASYSVIVSRSSLKELLLECENVRRFWHVIWSTGAHCGKGIQGLHGAWCKLQQSVLRQRIVWQMALVGAVGTLSEDLVAAQLKQLALWIRVGWWLVCSSQVFGRAPSGS